jgi:hypothetical protein
MKLWIKLNWLCTCYVQQQTHISGVAFNITHVESRETHLLYTAINTIEHG